MNQSSGPRKAPTKADDARRIGRARANGDRRPGNTTMISDVKRAMLRDPDLFARFRAPQKALPLPRARLANQEQLLVFARAEEKRALLVRQMAYHHVAQGELAGEPFLITF